MCQKSNLISRQAAIKNAHFPVIDDAGYEVVRVDDILALPTAKPKTGWIPVSERLPDKEERVLVTDSGYIEFGKLIYGLFGDLWLIWVGDYWVEATKVTAWMPLPESYREDGEE